MRIIDKSGGASVKMSAGGSSAVVASGAVLPSQDLFPSPDLFPSSGVESSTPSSTQRASRDLTAMELAVLTIVATVVGDVAREEGLSALEAGLLAVLVLVSLAAAVRRFPKPFL